MRVALRSLLYVVLLAVMPAAFAQENPTLEETPIRSQAALDDYLARQGNRPTPFDALPAGARERFFLSLRWGSRSLGGFDPNVLADELPQAQIDAILRLFGEESVRYAPRSRRSGPASASASISDVERRYNDFYRVLARDDLDTQAVSALLAERFDALLSDAYSPTSLQALDDRHLAMLWNAARSTAMLSNEPRHIAAMESVFTETVRRTGSVSSDRLRNLRDVLLAARRFEEARHAVERYPDTGLAAFPSFIDPPGNAATHTVWNISGNGENLEREAIDLSGTLLLVTAGCHFSRDAAEDITADPVLGPAFARHAHWLMLPPGNEDIEAALEWNRRFPQAPARMIYSREEWPMFPEWVMPQFHVVRDGRIVRTVSGWPRGDAGKRAELIELLREAGLLDS